MTVRFMLVYATLVVLFAAITVPALGAEALNSVQPKIAQTVTQAEAAMQLILNEFTSDALNASTQEELTQLQYRAHADIDTIYETAISKLNGYLALYPDELDAEVDAAKLRLKQSDAAAHAEINSITEDILPTLPPGTTTTTSTAPPTTTTTVTPTTTTLPPTRITVTTTSTAPTTTTTVASTTTTRASSTTTTVASSGAPTPPPPPGADQPTATGSNDTMTPSAVFDTSIERTYSFAEAMRSDSRMMTGALVQGMSVVLPPTVATAVLSLPIVLEMVLGTLFDSAQALLVPVLILSGAAMIIIWRESKSRSSLVRRTT